jgi:DNA repair protein RadA/Sms
MAKPRTRYVCQQCGADSAKWLGRCPDCGSWNSYVEEPGAAATRLDARAAADPRSRMSTAVPERLSDVSLADIERLPTGETEFDRVLGGGIVPGSMVLIGGDPGIGKSTLLLQVAAHVAADGRKVLYVSGEESARQVRLRAERLGTLRGDLYVLGETNLDAVLAHASDLRPSLLIVDSIQTAFLADVPSSPGNVAQLRECTLRLMNAAKSQHLPVFIVGHVTKEGNIAGPRVLEHIVDCVLYLEGERFYSYRLLRAAKNRFGSTNEVGVFEMDQDGLREVPNPSAAFLAERLESSAGSAVTVPLEGSRALLVEVQALVAGTGLAMPRRTAVGVDLNRLMLLIAVLAKRVGLPLGAQDVYVNLVAGLKIAEPAIDLGIALAIASSAREAPIAPGVVAIGEIGLLGELRPVGQVEKRLAEAARLGFERCILPEANLRRLTNGQTGRGTERNGMSLVGARTVEDALAVALGAAGTARPARAPRRAPAGYDAMPDRAAPAVLAPLDLLADAAGYGDRFDDQEDDQE